MYHQYQYSSRSQRSKGLKAKHVFQIALFLAISIWLVYQMKKFYHRRHDYTADTVINLDKEFHGMKFGRKEKLDGIQMVPANRGGVDDIGDRKEDGGGDDESEKSTDKEVGDEVLNATNEESEETMDNHEEEDNEKQQEKEDHGEKSEIEATNEENVENESSDDQHKPNKGDIASSDDQEQHLGENDNDDQLKDGEGTSQEESQSSEEQSTHSDEEEEHQQEEEESTPRDKTINGHKEEEHVLDGEQKPQKKEENAEEVKEQEVGQQEHRPNDQENVKHVHDGDNSTASGIWSESTELEELHKEEESRNIEEENHVEVQNKEREEEVDHQDQVQPKFEENAPETEEEEPQTKEEEAQSKEEVHSGSELNNEEEDQVVHQEEHNNEADNSTMHNTNNEGKPDSQIPNSESRAPEIGGEGASNQEEQNADNSATATEIQVQTSSEETTLGSQDNANNDTEDPQFKLSDNYEASINVAIEGGSSSDNPTEGAMDNGAGAGSSKPQKYEATSETDSNHTKVENNIVLQNEDANSVNEFASETKSTVLAES